jgi:predicted O-methyltransferase YrrM
MGLATVLGVARRGFFIPYRHAAAVPRPPDPEAGGYPAVERLFAAHEGAFAAALDAVDAHAGALSAIAGPAPEPRWEQGWFPRLDAAAAYALVRERRPARIVEVGSGHSTRFMARAARDGGLATRILCIDPAPRARLPQGVEHRAALLSPAMTGLFAALGPGDVAFFDSSHVLAPHGDVDLILNHILPVLAPGVLVHVHDVFLPDPYPAGWGWRGYAEQNGLGGWLLGGAFRPVFASAFALSRMGAARRPAIARLPLVPGALESSLWMEKR